MNSAPRVVVVGGGISGLAAAWRLNLRRPDLRITVVEASSRFGGKLMTLPRDGGLVEGAADGFLARKPPALAWCQDLGLGTELVEPRPEHRFSQVLWEGVLHPLPEGFSGLVPADPEGLRKTTLLTVSGADRASGESAVPLRQDRGEESVAEFLGRRYGAEAFDRLMEPLLSGIYAGDARRLSAEAAVPQLVELERRGQSLTAGMGAAVRNSGPAFRSLAGGMARLPEALEAELRRRGTELAAGLAVTALEKTPEGFVVRAGRESFTADAVVLALPPRAAGKVLRALSPGQAAILESWPVSSVANLTLAFDASEVPHLPPGSGFVCPRAGGTAFSAATWSSRKWPGRAPAGTELARFYFGGARDPEGWRLPEEEMVESALKVLALFEGGRRPQLRWRQVFRWGEAFAQPDLGHAGRHGSLASSSVPGVVLAGGYFAGVGIPDCLARAGSAAEEVDLYLSSVPQGASA